MFCGLNAKGNHCHISKIENLVAKIRSVKFSFLLSILWFVMANYQGTLFIFSSQYRIKDTNAGTTVLNGLYSLGPNDTGMFLF